MAFPNTSVITTFLTDENPISAGGLLLSVNMQSVSSGGGKAVPITTGDCYIYTATDTSNGNCESYVQMRQFSDPLPGFFIIARMDSATFPFPAHYSLRLSGPNGGATAALVRRSASVDTTLVTASAISWVDFTVFGLACTDTTITGYKDGVAFIGPVNDTGGFTTAGKLGMEFLSGGVPDPQVYMFGGGATAGSVPASTFTGAGAHERLLNRAMGRGIWRV